jgi:hypothetical protein
LIVFLLSDALHSVAVEDEVARFLEARRAPAYAPSAPSASAAFCVLPVAGDTTCLFFGENKTLNSNN